MKCRKGEEETIRFRSDRFFIVDDAYYFSTREMENIGPFTTKEDAEAGMKTFVTMLADQNASVELAAKTAVEGKWLQYIDY